MNYLVIVLRLIHILGGVFWVGRSLFLGIFISPTVASTAEAGQRFMGHLVTKTKVTTAITIAAILTALAGVFLYWIDSNSTSGWSYTLEGFGYSIGAIFGIIGFVFGVMVGRNIGLLGKMASVVQGKPTPEQLGKIQAAQKQLKIVTPISLISLILALACMAIAGSW